MQGGGLRRIGLMKYIYMIVFKHVLFRATVSYQAGSIPAAPQSETVQGRVCGSGSDAQGMQRVFPLQTGGGDPHLT